MALNQESIIQSMQNITPYTQQDVLRRRAEYEAALASRDLTQTPTTFESTLQQKLLNRDIMPSVTRQEREIAKKFFTAPSTVRQRLGGTLSPLDTEKLVSGQLGNLKDQLDALADLRSGKSDELKDMISSMALGYKTDYEKQQSAADAAKARYDIAWDEWKEQVRQQERREDEAKSTASKTAMKNTIEAELLQYRAEQAKLQGENWDHYTSVDKYLELRNKAYGWLGPEGTDWFDTKFPLYEQVNPTSALNPDKAEFKQIQDAGLDYDESIMKAADTVKTSLMEEGLSDCFNPDQFKRLLNPKKLFGDQYDVGYFDILSDLSAQGTEPNAAQKKVVYQILRAFNQGTMTEEEKNQLLTDLFGSRGAGWQYK